jgi:hypothetical protein
MQIHSQTSRQELILDIRPRKIVSISSYVLRYNIKLLGGNCGQVSTGGTSSLY